MVQCRKKKYILKTGLTTGYGTLGSCNSNSLHFLFCTVFLKYTRNLSKICWGDEETGRIHYEVHKLE